MKLTPEQYQALRASGGIAMQAVLDDMDELRAKNAKLRGAVNLAISEINRLNTEFLPAPHHIALQLSAVILTTQP